DGRRSFAPGWLPPTASGGAVAARRSSGRAGRVPTSLTVRRAVRGRNLPRGLRAGEWSPIIRFRRFECWRILEPFGEYDGKTDDGRGATGARTGDDGGLHAVAEGLAAEKGESRRDRAGLRGTPARQSLPSEGLSRRRLRHRPAQGRCAPVAQELYRPYS